MNTALKPLNWILFWSAAAGMAAGGFAAAQESPPATPPSGASQSTPSAGTAAQPARGKASSSKSTAQIDAGEPRAETSPSVPGGASSTSNAASAPGVPSAGTAVADKPAASQPGARAPKSAGQKPGGVDRLQLDTATVTGDREQPKVMYIVPWKSSEIGDLSGKPMNSLLDEALAPVDRDEFKREVVYFDAVKADRSQNAAPGGAAQQGEK
ncbi:MAG TPA: hypothetical protein VKP66_14405 [Steroidobacteraceae bacterium]|nr:hypothetical protein [Steroidobacteraceae bacterium]